MKKRYILIILIIVGLLGVMAGPVHAATITVTNTNDSGPGSLRQAIASALAGDTIDFSVTGTITLTTGQLTIGKNLTITGPGPGSLTISGNNASRIFMVNSGFTLNLSGVTITTGRASDPSGWGGGISNEGTLHISDSVITNCLANGSGNGFGGGIDNYGGAATVTITRCTISGNTANNEGGGIRNENGTLTITESTIYNNTSGNVGGGITAYGGTLNITNSTISGNNATGGGGGIFDGAAVTMNINQCTIVNNTSTSGGGGIDLVSTTANIKNTILANNTGGGGNNFFNGGSGALNSQGYNLANDAVTAFVSTGDQQNATPNLAAIAGNGGPTQTHALQTGSDAIDKIPEGGNSYNGAPPADQRGYGRSGANYDVGAFEYQGKPPISGNAGVGGATLSYNDGGAQTATADGSGNYLFYVSYNWSGTVTPSSAGYVFTPPNRTYTNVILPQTNQDYTAASGYLISGTVTDGTNPIQGVTITFSHDGHTETTAADGTYSYGVASGTTTTITPGHPGYSGWNPPNRTINNIAANAPGQDFQGTINTYTISGTVIDGVNPIQGATITFSHNGHTETTGAAGTYSYIVPFGTTTTITPGHPGFSGWNPPNRTINNISTNTPGQDFQGTINTYTISGTVTDGVNPIQGATITFSHNGHTETTGPAGTYSYIVPFGTTTTITPSHPGFSGWIPPNRTINNIAANAPGQDFQGTINTYTISGTVTDGTNPAQGVTITFSHNGHTETTGPAGTYSYVVPFGTTTTITPSHPGFSGWTPPNRTINNIGADAPGQDFQGTVNTYTISGTVTDGVNPIQGVTVTFSHDGHTETTAADGTYAYAVPYGTTTTITPGHAGYSGWNPPNRTINNIAADTPNQDFQGTINTYTISGTVADGTNPIAGVTITFSHDSHTETTAADGTYAYTVPYGTTTTITPDHAGYPNWTPANRTINNISADQPNQDFQGNTGIYLISGTVTDGTNPLPGVTITFSHDNHTEITDANGYYSNTVTGGTTTTITPSKEGYSFTPTAYTIVNISANKPNRDFTASAALISVTITEPQEGEQVSGTVTIKAAAASSQAAAGEASIMTVTKVEFYIDDSKLTEDTTEPYEATWDTTTAADGSHTIKAVAYSAANRTAQDKITVQVINAPPGPPEIMLNRTRLNFGSEVQAGAATSGIAAASFTTGPQTILINNVGGGTLNWTVSKDADWLICTPGSGDGNGIVAVSVDAAGLSVGTYTGAISVQDPNAVNSPVTVPVTLKIYSTGSTTSPFGYFETPTAGAMVQSSVPVTGWAVDDIEITSVKIFRAPIPGHEIGMIYIGDAVLVDGARPDVEETFPDYPKNYQAGWGYMLLTNFLPNQGNGTFTLYAIAMDKEGNEVTLGSKTITGDNANAVKPFGAIDTPGQGGIASGKAFANFGWALAPQPNTVPTDGSTIIVWVDGVPLGNPSYNNYREDIASLFPGYNNSSGAGGYFYLDTSKYLNGVHTIAWSVKDDAGNQDGVGSRFFTIQNIESAGISDLSRRGTLRRYVSNSEVQAAVLSSGPIYVITGYNRDAAPKVYYPDDEGIITIGLEEGDRIEILFGSGEASTGVSASCGYMLKADRLQLLPGGSFMDIANGIFYWQPCAGFLGKYQFVFAEKSANGHLFKKLVNLVVNPKY